MLSSKVMEKVSYRDALAPKIYYIIDYTNAYINFLGTVRSRIDSIMPGLLGAEEAVRLARQFLNSR